MAMPSPATELEKSHPPPYTPPLTHIRGDTDDKPVQKFPQAIAHRGYCAEYPENTMSAFVAAMKAGAHALETDMHLSKDGVVVLSHDATLKRCFGKDGKIIDYDWSYLSTLRTLKEPHDAMPRLLDLLEYLASPGLENIWLLLDIKVDNDADDIIRSIAQTIHQVPASSTPWAQRIVLGCWALEYLPLCSTHLPAFPITHIGLNLTYARRFLQPHLPPASFTLLQPLLMTPAGQRFTSDARAANRAIYAWTVNKRSMMRWSIRAGLDGVITDDPGTFLRVCGEYEDGVYTAEDRLTLKTWLGIVGVNVLTWFFGAFFRWRYGFGVGGKTESKVRLSAGTKYLNL